LTTKDGTVLVDGSQPTTFSVSASRGRTSVTTLSGIAQFKAGGSVKQIAAGESATAGVPRPDSDDDHGMSGGALAVLLLAIGGAVAGVLYAAFHNNDLNFGGSVTVVSPTK
jgi:hypothetical protein